MPLEGMIKNMQGLQALAAQRDQNKQNAEAYANSNIAKEALQKYQKSLQDGNEDVNALNTAVLNNPQMAQNVLNSVGIVQKHQGQDAANFALSAYGAIDNKDKFLNLLHNRVQYLSANNRDPSDTLALGEQYASGDVEGAKRNLQTLSSALTNQGYLDKDLYAQTFGIASENNGVASSNILDDGTTVQVLRSGETRVTDPQGRVLTGEQRAAAIKNAQNYGASIQAARAGGRQQAISEVDLNYNPLIKGAETSATKGSESRSAYKTQGISAAENIPTLKRALQLQKEIATGGGANSLRKVANYLGVSSENEGELNSLFGQNILGQLKSTFGGSPTEGERAALEQAQASFSQSGKINEKLLDNALKLAELRVRRGRTAAKVDKDEDTVKYIDDALSVDFSEPTKKGAKLQYNPATGRIE
jgi:hypothetical protein